MSALLVGIETMTEIDAHSIGVQSRLSILLWGLGRLIAFFDPLVFPSKE
jgi:hypothetical protein